MARVVVIAVVGAVIAAGIILTVALRTHDSPAPPPRAHAEKHGTITTPKQPTPDKSAREKTASAQKRGTEETAARTGEGSAPESDDFWDIGPIDPNNPAALYLEAFKLMVDPMDEQFVGEADGALLAQMEKIEKILKEGWKEKYPEILQILEANREALEKLKEAIDSGGCYFPIPEDADYSLRLLHMLAARCAATLLALEARFFEKEKDIENAARNIADGIKFSQDIAREGPVISDLVSIAAQNTFLNIIQSELRKEQPNLRFCSAIERSLYDLEYTQAFVEKGLEVEKRMFEQTCKNLSTMSKEELDAFLDNSHPAVDAKTIEKTVRIYGEYYEELSNALKAGLTPAMKKVAELSKQMEAKAKELPELLLLLCPAFDGYLKNKGRQIVSYEMARTGVALELHKAQSGDYPNSLAELVPKYLPRVPVDPFSGKPLGYGKGDKGWTLHSFGFDLDDDNAKKEAKSRSDDGDIILRKKQ